MSVTIPSAIQRQVEDAERLQSELYGQDAAPVETPTEKTDSPEAVETPEAAPAPVAEQKVETAQEQKPVDDYEHRYNVMKGKYEAEVPRMQQQLREQARQMQELQARLEQATKQPEQPPAEEKALVTEKDVEDFGADLVDMVRRASQDETAKQLKAALSEFRKEIAAVLAQVGTVREQVQLSAEERFWGKVITLVPDWKQIDGDDDAGVPADQSWLDFLDTRIPGTRKTRRQEAADAIAEGRPELIKELVDLWRGPPEVTTPQAKNQELQRQVVPPTSKASTPPQPAGRVLSKAEYEALYDPRNVQRFGQTKADEMIAEADLAVAQGRVRW